MATTPNTTHASKAAQESTAAAENAPEYRCLQRASDRATATTLINTAWASESNKVVMATTSINTFKAIANPNNLSTDKVFSQLPYCIESFGAITTNHQCKDCDCTIHWFCTMEAEQGNGYPILVH